MANLNTTELRRIEKEFADGIKSVNVVAIFQDKGERFSEATLRKYVQLGLLPTSKRVGVRGRHRGSAGLYPVSIVRLINDIKTALDAGATLEEVRFGVVGLTGEVEVLRKTCEQVWRRFDEAITRAKDDQKKGSLKRALVQKRRSLEKQVAELDRFAMQVARSDAR